MTAKDTGTGAPFALTAPAALGGGLRIMQLMALLGRGSRATRRQDITPPAALWAVRRCLL